VTSWCIQPFGPNKHGTIIGGCALLFFGGGWERSGSASNTMSPGLRPTSVPTGIWSIQWFGDNRHGRKFGAVPLLRKGSIGPHLAQCGLGRVLPPHQVMHSPVWPVSDFYDLLQQLPPPILIIGDFNSHSTLRGCTKLDRRGKVVEDILIKHNLCILNDTSPTYIHPDTGSYLAIDLSICSPDIFSRHAVGNFEWSVWKWSLSHFSNLWLRTNLISSS